MKIVIILCSILIYGFNCFCQDEFLSGLYFSSHEVIQEQRTSLNLTPSKPYKFPDGFSLEMEANFRKGDGHYGYIFRIIADGNTNIDLVSNLASNASNFWLVIKDKVLVSYNWADIPEGDFGKWIKIKVDLDIRNSRLTASFNGNEKHAQLPVSGLKDFEIVFGACRHTSFFNTDVSPMALKNIRIFDSKNELVREWKLSKHSEPIVFDEIKHAEALVENPLWSIDKQIKWEKVKNFKFDNLQGIAQDEDNGRVFFVDNHAVYIFSTETAALDTLLYKEGQPYLAEGREIIYNKYRDELWSYDFFKNDISKFSFITKQWSMNPTTARHPDFWHHNRFISPLDSSLVTLFGYGHYTYKSVINRYSETLNGWEKTDVKEQINPRYLSGAGFLNDHEMLIFGGYGSKTGRQELSPEFYYDLHLLNLDDFTFKKLWTLPTPSSPFVPSESLIADPQNGIFYTLLYNSGSYSTYLRLAKFNIKTSEYQLFTDSIPFNFLDIQSRNMLFLDKKTDELMAVTLHNSDVSLYSIAYPPLMPGDVHQNIPAKISWMGWLTGIILAGGLSIIAFVRVGKKRNLFKSEKFYQQVDHPNILPIEAMERKTLSSVYLMGGFQIYNQKGKDITSAFSPTLKQLFLFLFLNTNKNGKGVSSSKLDEVLWHDKIGESARNNRNVNISKLRSLLEEIGGFEVINENSYWKIRTDQTEFCDYTEIMDLLRRSKQNELTESEVHRLIALISFGELLPLMQMEWIEDFKSRFANEVVEGLSALMNENKLKNNLSLRYHLAECILVYDPLNDEAFALKCSVMYHLGKKGMAKNLYDSFCREYKKVLGIDFATSFNEII